MLSIRGSARGYKLPRDGPARRPDRHRDFPLYFARAFPWERGTNENTHELTENTS